ncbi:hypothetical protein P879_02035 [Paragonimus westermani]|uniref:C2H2-type domain-containing protein n=1 Tax=Paragonimus westermani TaxID=34504 RepID=A0A8T0DAQ3_9TREM|nr:hypothetical protein P879_02035 [Paragonimus westermani]
MVLDSKDRFKPSSKMRKKPLEVDQRTDHPPKDDEEPTRPTDLVTGSAVPDPHVVENMDYDKPEHEGITVILPVTSLRSVQRPQTGQKRPARDEEGSPDSGPTKATVTEEKRIRKFICRYCNKAFSLMNVLKVHERIHTGEKPYICDICDKAFNQSGSLNRHKNTHLKRSSDNRSYSCRYCPRQFLHSSHLQDHEASEHGASAKVATTSPVLDSSVPNLYETKSRSSGFCEMNAVSSPMRIRGFTGADSGLSLTDEIPTSLPNLGAVTNMFTKFDTNSIGYPPLSVALSLFNSQTNTYSISSAENSTFKVSDKHHPTMNRYPDSRTENLSPDTCTPRTTEFEKRMIQQIGKYWFVQNGFIYPTASAQFSYNQSVIFISLFIAFYLGIEDSLAGTPE